jgi:predicted Zn-dependent peptidase
MSHKYIYPGHQMGLPILG